MEENIDKRAYELQHALAYAENIISTLREPFLVLDRSLRVRTANAAFYRDFHVSKEETEGRFVYDLGDGQWDIPRLRTLLPQVLSNSHPVEDFEVDHAYPALGRRTMLLNARRFPPESNDPDLVLLAFEDVTDRRRAEAAMQHFSNCACQAAVCGVGRTVLLYEVMAGLRYWPASRYGLVQVSGVRSPNRNKGEPFCSATRVLS